MGCGNSKKRKEREKSRVAATEKNEAEEQKATSPQQVRSYTRKKTSTVPKTPLMNTKSELPDDTLGLGSAAFGVPPKSNVEQSKAGEVKVSGPYLARKSLRPSDSASKPLSTGEVLSASQTGVSSNNSRAALRSGSGGRPGGSRALPSGSKPGEQSKSDGDGYLSKVNDELKEGRPSSNSTASSQVKSSGVISKVISENSGGPPSTTSVPDREKSTKKTKAT